MFITGYIVSGLGYGLLLASTPAGPLFDTLSYFDVHLSPSAIFSTIARSSITTAILFGVFESVSQISATTSLETVWSFITDQTVKEITLWRFAFGTLFVFIAFPLLVHVASGPVGSMSLGRQAVGDQYPVES